MTEEEFLRRVVIDHPYEDGPRFSYADWCDRRNAPAPPPDPRGEFIRLQIELEHSPRRLDVPLEVEAVVAETRRQVARRKDEARERELRETFGPLWAQPLMSVVDGYRYDRGFVAEVSLPAISLIEHADQIFA